MPKSKPSEVEIVAMLLRGAYLTGNEMLLAHDCVKDWNRMTPTAQVEYIDDARAFLRALKGKP